MQWAPDAEAGPGREAMGQRHRQAMRALRGHHQLDEARGGADDDAGGMMTLVAGRTSLRRKWPLPAAPQ